MEKTRSRTSTYNSQFPTFMELKLASIYKRADILIHWKIKETYGSHLTISLIFFFLFELNTVFSILYFKSNVSTLSLCCIILKIWLSGTIFTRTFQYDLWVPFSNQKPHFRFTCFLLAYTIKWKIQNSFSIK